MTKPLLVDADKIETVENYIAQALVSTLSLKTLLKIEATASNKGFLGDDGLETSKTICWEIQRLIMLFKAQIEALSENHPINQKDVVKMFKDMAGEIPKKPRKKKVHDE